MAAHIRQQHHSTQTTVSRNIPSTQLHPTSPTTLKMSRALLITGATGKQGGSVINALLARNADFKILAVTRDAASASAQRLAAKSPKISIVQGNLDDTDSVFQNAKKVTPLPIWGVFSVQVGNLYDK